MSDATAVWIIGASVILAVAVVVLLRSTIPGVVGLALLFLSGVGIGVGGVVLQEDPSTLESALAIGLIALAMPVHARIVVGPLGRGTTVGGLADRIANEAGAGRPLAGTGRAGATAAPELGNGVAASTETGYELLEHTADIGIRAWGPDLAVALEQTIWGLVEILDARSERGATEQRRIEAAAVDESALVVDLLNEVIALHEAEECTFAGVAVRLRGSSAAEVALQVTPVDRELDSVGVKAATFHQLSVESSSTSAHVSVYLDV